MAQRGRPPHPGLTPAEERVLQLVREGMSNAEIAVRLGVSVNTVRYHVSNLLSKASLTSRTELAAWQPKQDSERRGWLTGGALGSLLRPLGYGVGAAASVAAVAIAVLAILGLRDADELTEPFVPPEVAAVVGDASAGVLVIDYGDREGWDSGQPGAARGALVVVGGAEGSELSGWGPIDAGHGGTAILSPDGSYIALGRHSSQSSGASLVVFRLADGAEVASYASPERLGLLEWSPDSRSIYGISGELGGPRAPAQPAVWVFEPASGSVRQLTPIDVDFYMIRADIGSEGDLLYALAFNALECCGIDVQGDPFVAVVNLSTGAVEDRIPLPGLVLGQRFEERGGAGNSYNIIRWPASALSPDGRRLYIAHADENRITVVDLQRREVERTVEPKAQRSRLRGLADRVAAFFVGNASAKSGGYYTKQLVTSPDGRRLYVTGYEAIFCDDTPHFSCAAGPIGLQVLDAESLRVVGRFEGIGALAFSRDGQTLVGWSFAYDYRGLEEDEMWAKVLAHGPVIIDAATLSVRAAVELRAPAQEVRISGDGAFVYALSQGPGYNDAMLNQGRCTAVCTILTVIDARTGAIVGERELSSAAISFAELPRGTY